VEQFSQRLDGRLASFARTQSYLAFPARKIDLEMLLRDELLAHAAGFSDQVAISGPEVRLAPRVAQTLGLTLHELVAAAVESGALEDKDGSVSAAWRVEGTAPDLRLRFEWRERRTSHFNSAEEDDQGLDLLSRALVYELDADVAVDLSGEGLYFAVEFRLPDDRAEFY
jgi:two-component system CheB/CheR fusion protein